MFLRSIFCEWQVFVQPGIQLKNSCQQAAGSWQLPARKIWHHELMALSPSDFKDCQLLTACCPLLLLPISALIRYYPSDDD